MNKYSYENAGDTPREILVTRTAAAVIVSMIAALLGAMFFI